jgi:hypothetical protein
MLRYNLRYILRQTMGTDNGKVARDISNEYWFGEGETPQFRIPIHHLLLS